MYLKFARRGDGDAETGTDYLLQPLDANQKARDEVVLLSGHAPLFADVVNSLPFVNRYTSVITAYESSDRPSVQEVLDDQQELLGMVCVSQPDARLTR